MLKHEAKILSDFMRQLSERFGNDGSNDFELPNTKENRKLIESAERHCLGYFDGIHINKYNGSVGTSNHIVLDYLQYVFMKENDLI